MELETSEGGYERPHIPEGIHHAELLSAGAAPDGQYGPRIALDFLVFYDKEKKPVQLGRIFGKKLTPKSKLWEALAALGAKLKVGEKVDTVSLQGNPCRVSVEDYNDDEGKTVSGIIKVKTPDENSSTFIAEMKDKFRNEETASAKSDNAKPDIEVEDVK